MAKREHRKLSASKLFKTAEDLVDGYSLYVDRKKNRKVNLIGRPLTTGNVSLFRYSFQNGRKVLEKTGAVLIPETSQEVKNDNKRTLLAQNTICDELNVTLIRENANFKPINKSRVSMWDFVEECKADMKQSFTKGLTSLQKHMKLFNPKLRVCDMDVETTRDFITYLKEDATKIGDEGKDNAPRLKENTQYDIVAKLSIVLNKAVEKELLRINPLTKISSSDRPKMQDDVRTYLTKDELRSLINTPYTKKAVYPDLAGAFLFSCFTGLRFSDIKGLRGKNVGVDDGGKFIIFRVQKTKRIQKLYLNPIAEKYLPKVKANEAEFTLPTESNVQKDLKVWTRNAGIKKHITFHCARHTCATLMLSAHVPLEVVSNQLGHKSVKTTQRYAKITGDNQRQGANQMANFFIK